VDSQVPGSVAGARPLQELIRFCLTVLSVRGFRLKGLFPRVCGQISHRQFLPAEVLQTICYENLSHKPDPLRQTSGAVNAFLGRESGA
jgi:hypothetical protein